MIVNYIHYCISFSDYFFVSVLSFAFDFDIKLYDLFEKSYTNECHNEINNEFNDEYNNEFNNEYNHDMLMYWKDAWIEAGSNRNTKITYDSTTNPLLRAKYANINNPPCYISRLDRILHLSKFHVLYFDVIKTEQIISDHYAIFAIFGLNDLYDSNDQLSSISTTSYLELNRCRLEKAKSILNNRNKYINSPKKINEKLKTVSLFKKR